MIGTRKSIMQDVMQDVIQVFCLMKHQKVSTASSFFLFFNWDSLHAKLNSHYEAWSYKKKKHKKDYSIQEICLERTYS